MVRLFGRRKAAEPYRHTHDSPQQAGAWLFTLRSTPRHHDELKAAIESTGDARVWFSEELSYIRGKGVSVFRVEATGFDWIEALMERAAEIERREAFPFDIDLYLHNRQWAASFRHQTPEEIAEIIRTHAPTHQPAVASGV